MTSIIFLSTIFKTIYKKLSPEKIKYVGFKKCSAFSLKDSLQNSIFIQQDNIGSIQPSITKNLNKEAPLKTRAVRGNNNTYHSA